MSDFYPVQFVVSVALLICGVHLLAHHWNGLRWRSTAGVGVGLGLTLWGVCGVASSWGMP